MKAKDFKVGQVLYRLTNQKEGQVRFREEYVRKVGTRYIYTSLRLQPSKYECERSWCKIAIEGINSLPPYRCWEGIVFTSKEMYLHELEANEMARQLYRAFDGPGAYKKLGYARLKKLHTELLLEVREDER